MRCAAVLVIGCVILGLADVPVTLKVGSGPAPCDCRTAKALRREIDVTREAARRDAESLARETDPKEQRRLERWLSTYKDRIENWEAVLSNAQRNN